jgi:5-methyltetrahydropteroyltriglutamate--homocysteine methyltransferase
VATGCSASKREEREMFLDKYATSVVGSYSVPRWYEALEKQVEAGELSPEDMADVQFRATQAAIADQEASGVDIIGGGEMHRRTNNRHAPPNAMLNHFWARIPGLSNETRPKSITPKDADVTHPGAVLNGKIEYGDLGLVDEFRMVSRFTGKEVKITMTGPHMLAKVAHDEHYGDIKQIMQDLAKVLNRNFRDLQEAGCKHIQVDEPLFAAVERDEVEAAVEAINAAFEGIDGMYKWVHICQGNYSVSDEFDRGDQIGHRYFDFGEYPADLISRIECDALMVEYDFVGAYEGLLGEKQLAFGAADVQNRQVETPEQIVERVQAQRWLKPEQTLLTTSCGLNHLPRELAFAKLKAIADASAALRGDRAPTPV